MPLTTRNRLPQDRHFAFYRNKDGVVNLAQLTDEEYAALAKPMQSLSDDEITAALKRAQDFGMPKSGMIETRGVPPHPDFPASDWFCFQCGGGSPTFDTADGFLKPGDYYPGDKKLEPIAINADGTELTGDDAIAEASK